MIKNAINAQRKYTTHIGGRLSIFTACGDLEEDARYEQPIEDGLRLIVSSINMDLEASNVDRQEFRKPVAFAILSDGENERRQHVFRGRERWDIAITLDRQIVREEFGKEPEDLLAHSTRSRLTLRAKEADASIRALGLQLMSIPEGQTNNMARLGMGLSLATFVLSQLANEEETRQAPLKLTDMDRIAYVRELLRSDFAKAPSVSALAQMTGTNTAKLNRDFLAVTGMTPHAWLQEERLKEGWRLLSVKTGSVSEAAHLVGYTPAHFSNLFRKRFKISPRSLLTGGEV
ncbi:MAG: AraC family transcriptional regulator [Pseudomonadota bacterium]